MWTEILSHSYSILAMLFLWGLVFPLLILSFLTRKKRRCPITPNDIGKKIKVVLQTNQKEIKKVCKIISVNEKEITFEDKNGISKCNAEKILRIEKSISLIFLMFSVFTFILVAVIGQIVDYVTRDKGVNHDAGGYTLYGGTIDEDDWSVSKDSGQEYNKY